MRAISRLAVGVVAAIVSTALAVAPALAQAPGTLPAGQYHTVSNMAGFFSFDGSTGLNITVTDLTNKAAPIGRPSTTTHTTQAQIEIFSDTFSGLGCYDIAPGDFAFSTSAATLHAKITATTGTCGQPPGNLPTPFSLDMTLTGIGPSNTGRQVSSLACGGYRADTTVTNDINNASGVASIDPVLAGQFTQSHFQLLRTDDTRIHAQGVSPETCQPAPGIPGGAGPPRAGDYTSTSTEADLFIFSDTGPTINVDVTNSASTSRPKGAPATTTAEFDVRIGIFGGGVFEFGCFNLSPADFSSTGVSSASLNTTFTDSSPTCDNSGPATLPLPLTVNVVWTASAPAVTLRSQGTFNCLTYHSTGSGLDLMDNANVTATISPALADPITSDQGTLTTRSSAVHAQGAQQPACHL